MVKIRVEVYIWKNILIVAVYLQDTNLKGFRKNNDSTGAKKVLSILKRCSSGAILDWYICEDAGIRMRNVRVYFLTNLDSPRVSGAVCLLALLRWAQLVPPLGYTAVFRGAWEG